MLYKDSAVRVVYPGREGATFFSFDTIDAYSEYVLPDPNSLFTLIVMI